MISHHKLSAVCFFKSMLRILLDRPKTNAGVDLDGEVAGSFLFGFSKIYNTRNSPQHLGPLRTDFWVLTI